MPIPPAVKPDSCPRLTAYHCATASGTKPGLLAAAESWLCGALAILLLIEVIVAGTLLVMNLKTATVHLPRWVSLPPLLLAVPVNCVLVARIVDALRKGRHPMPLDVARMYLPMKSAARIGYSIIWAVYALSGLCFAYVWSAAAEWQYQHGLELGAVAGIFIIGCGITFLANIFVVLFLSALTGGLAASAAFWRRRIWIDFAITTALTLGAMMR